MQQILIKLGLVEIINFNMAISRNEFVKELKAKVAYGDTNLFADPNIQNVKSHHEFFGEVNDNNFEIKLLNSALNETSQHSIARGRYIQANERLKVEAEINSFNGIMIPISIIFILLYLVIASFLIFYGVIAGEQGFLILLMIIVGFVFGAWTLRSMMRRDLKSLKRALESMLNQIGKK